MSGRLEAAPVFPDLDPAVIGWAQRTGELAADLPGLASEDQSVRRAAALRLSDLLAEEYTEPVPDGARIDDLTVAGGDGPIRARRFRPRDATGPLPTLVWCHGGGFVGGTIDEILNDRLCADRALRSGVQIISLEYRLAPEHPFPAAVEDAVAAVRDVRDRAHELDADPARIGIGGNSAGAAVTAIAALRLRDAGEGVHHQAFEVLPGALRPVGASSERFARGFGLDDAEPLGALYLAGASLAEASPLDAPDHSGLPPTVILVAEFDPLRDGALAYAEALRAAGVPVTVYEGAGHVHGSPALTAGWQGARDWRDAFVAALTLAYAPSDAPPPRD
ncbi:acetyl esterase [Microbacterium resistens]|uniref:Acetyl esterase n=1 Tax=Microbacterium resistens TaxID=156977 RepID=A0ABU1S9X7_9MICO|nr:alpha/beta hydrolase [Microbacterium resistens]MDR6865718.1 acetyl esterase [Microbacterium resistens]